MVVLATHEARFAEISDPDSERKRIDIWWVGGATSSLMLMLAYLMTRTEPWQHTQLRVLAQSQVRHPSRTEMEIRELLKEARIDAEVEMVRKITIDTVAEQSAAAAMVFFPFRIVKYRPQACFGLNLEKLLDQLLLVTLTIAGSDIELAAEPDADSEQE